MSRMFFMLAKAFTISGKRFYFYVKGAMPVVLTVNGNKQEMAAPCSLASFLKEKGLEPASVIVEYNGELVKEEHWNEIVLKENDCLEVLRFVGGG